MRALIQRVGEARVTVAGDSVGEIGRGLLVLLGVERGDEPAQVTRMAEKLLNFRVFADDQGKMNRSVVDIGGGVLLVSQFTLAADTRKGTRPGFSSAAPPEQARARYNELCQTLKPRCAHWASGRFGADMQVALVNDGPVTFLLEVR